MKTLKRTRNTRGLVRLYQGTLVHYYTGFAVTVTEPFFESVVLSLFLNVSFDFVDDDDEFLEVDDESLEVDDESLEVDEESLEVDDESLEVDDESLEVVSSSASLSLEPFNNFIRASRSSMLTLLLFIFPIISSIFSLSSLDVASFSS